jgi:MFS family permease
MQTLFKKNIYKIYAYRFFINFFFFVGILIPFFTIWGGISFFQVMLLQTFFVFSNFILEIPTGVVADYWGRKVSLALAAVFLTCAVLTYSIFPSFYFFLLGEFLWAIGFTLISGADEALIYDTLKEHNQEHNSKKFFGRLSSFEMAALMISAPIGSIIAAKLGLRHTMIFTAFPLFIGFIIALTIKEPKHYQNNKKKNFLEIFKVGTKYFLAHPILRILAFDRISIAALTFLLIWIYQPKLQSLDLPIIFFGVISSFILIMQIFVLNNFSKLEKLVRSKKNYLLISALLTGAAFIGLGLAEHIIISTILFGIAAGFGLTRFVLFQNYMNKYVESNIRATVASTISMIHNLFKGIVYLFLGLLAKWSLNYACIIIGLLIIACALASKVEEKHLID